MNHTNSISTFALISLGVLPLVLCLLATALLLQEAFLAESVKIADDALTGGLSGFIHPAAKGFLAAGYAVSFAAFPAALALRRRTSG